MFLPHQRLAAGRPVGSLRRFRRSLHHFIAVQRVAGIPGLHVPVLYLAEVDTAGEEVLRPLTSLTDYFVAHSAMSMTWMASTARALGKVYDYLRQRATYFEAPAERYINLHRVVTAEFQNHLSRGTIEIREPEGITDDTGLFWPPIASIDVAMCLMRGIHDFVGWLHSAGYGEHLQAFAQDLRAPPSNGRDAVRFLYAARYQREVSFFAATKAAWKQRRRPPGRDVFGGDSRDFAANETVRFPLRHLASLLLQGFTSRGAGGSGQGEDVAGKLATMFCGFGGLRMSEPLHLWLQDVQFVDADPVVFLHHPVRAMVVHEIHGEMTRSEYLRTFCGMEPRNHDGGKFHSGWKGIKTNSQYWAPIYWLPFHGVQEMLWSTLRTYLFDVRPRLMRQRRARGLPDHPFLLVSSGGANHEGDGTSIGDPYTRTAFRNSHRRAMARLRALRDGDPTLAIAKSLGTTLHGLRHEYGGLLEELGLSVRLRQECMHHVSPLSTLTYGQPRSESISDALNEAALRARSGEAPQASAVVHSTEAALRALLDQARGERA